MLQTVAALIFFTLFGFAAQAQSWVQVEAQPSRAEALARAEAYSDLFQDVNVFQTGTNWAAIALGPYPTEDDARRRLLELRARSLVPSDSFVSDGRTFRARIFGTNTASVAERAPAVPAPVLERGEETSEEARRSERNLTREERALLQTALRFEGFYNSVIDAAFGPGTRRAMSAWQAANGYEGTGILTTLQRRELIAAYEAVVTSLGLGSVIDEAAGIEIDLPTELVAFDRYDAPFAHYEAATDDGIKVVLISLSGDATTLAAYFDIMQVLEAVPTDGERSLGRESFTIEGRNGRIVSHTFARRAGDAVKGFSLIWPAGDEKRFRLTLDAMKASFRTTDAVLPDGMGSGAQDINLLAGLEIRRPEKSGSGFYVTNDGMVLTSHDLVRECRRVTLDESFDANVVAQDLELGVALLEPREALAPMAVARLAVSEPRLQSNVAVSGYSFGGVLSAPTLTFGTLADVKGLDGSNEIQRLAINSTPGDTGGPVFSGSGAVLGLLLANSTEGSRQLPAGVAFAADAPALATFLTANGVSPGATDIGEAIPPEDLTVLATDLTVLISCWS